MKICLIALSILLAATSAYARQILVPSEFSLIQTAIDSSLLGDTIIVADGHYFERVNFGSKAIVLASEFLMDSDTNHIINTVIDGDTSVTPIQDSASVIFVSDITGDTAIISGLTVQNGEGSILEVFSTFYNVGGGILCSKAAVKIQNCIIRNNKSNNLGGGIFSFSSQVSISKCTFSSNESSNGGGLCVYGSGGSVIDSCLFVSNDASEGGGANISFGLVTLQNSKFSGNTALLGGGLVIIDNSSSIINCNFQDNQAFKGGGIYCFQGADGDIINCEFYNNTASLQNSQQAAGGAICCLASSPLIRNCTMHQNYADSGGGIYVNNSALPEIENCIISSSKKGRAISCTPSLPLSVFCTDIFGNVGGDWVGCLLHKQLINGNLAVDPQYCQPNAPNLTLKSTSPCLAVNNSCAELIGANGLGCVVTDVNDAEDLLPYEYELNQNYPNPFNPSTMIEFALPKKNRIKVFVTNILGQTVAVLLDEVKSAGHYKLEWHGRDDFGAPSSSGVYFYTIKSEEFSASKKMVLLK